MTDAFNDAELPRLAMECAAMADADGCEANERKRLLTMRESLLALADNADWLAGKPADPRLQATQ